MTKFYLQYKNNSPVLIDTAHGRGPQGTLPLITVSHLIRLTRLPHSSPTVPLLTNSTLHLKIRAGQPLLDMELPSTRHRALHLRHSAQ
ncbi:hypothetical protein QVD99_000585 [Batrachochytrium dendrobatidis]|nr:hypothetical protein QVD99_000585 [Batrachochytrium dendrobatidis]